MSLKKLEITGTGASDAYYHTWLAEEYNKESFIKLALHKVREHFPGYNIRLFQLPQHTPIKWLETDKKWLNLAVLKTYDRPLVDLTHPELSKLYTKKQFKECRNRLKRLGEVTFEHITCIDQLSDIFDEMMDQFDFRKGATLNTLPFRSDPQKKEFLMELFRLDMLHVAVLKMNGIIVASLIATIGKDKWVHGVGINTHAPTYAAYSPGFISFIMLAQQLANKQYHMLDLSTGDQEYKKRMTNTQDQVYALVILSRNKSTFKIPNPLKEQVIGRLSEAGIDYIAFRAKLRANNKMLKAKWHLLKQQGITRCLVNSLKFTISREKEQIYKINTKNSITILKNTYACISQNSLKDLLRFSEGQSLKTRWEFLIEAMYRLEIGEQAYTYSEDNVLKACVWMSCYSKKQNIYAAKLDYPTEGAVLHGLYFHSDYNNKLPQFIEAVAAEIEKNQPGKQIYLITGPSVAAFCLARQSAC
ncbi:GNAT family N-acetyltransferase [Pontibacter lucknowensis]|nr:GNAT family N-acetyltransferase [Pontibacter lucknowensis]